MFAAFSWYAGTEKCANRPIQRSILMHQHRKRENVGVSQKMGRGNVRENMSGVMFYTHVGRLADRSLHAEQLLCGRPKLHDNNRNAKAETLGRLSVGDN